MCRPYTLGQSEFAKNFQTFTRAYIHKIILRCILVAGEFSLSPFQK